MWVNLAISDILAVDLLLFFVLPSFFIRCWCEAATKIRAICCEVSDYKNFNCCWPYFVRFPSDELLDTWNNSWCWSLCPELNSLLRNILVLSSERLLRKLLLSFPVCSNPSVVVLSIVMLFSTIVTYRNLYGFCIIFIPVWIIDSVLPPINLINSLSEIYNPRVSCNLWRFYPVVHVFMVNFF